MIPLHHRPGAQVLYVTSGTFGWTLVQGRSVVIVRAARAGVPRRTEHPTPGAQTLLRAGDSLYYNRDVYHTARVVGGRPVTVIIAALEERDGPDAVGGDEVREIDPEEAETAHPHG